MQRPQRWDHPFDPNMSASAVDRILGVEPFRSMSTGAFPPAVSLRGILQNDCRLLELKSGDIIIREGEYGSSAFLILRGEALVSLERLPPAVLGRSAARKKSWFSAIAQLWSNDAIPEVRDYSSANPASAIVGARKDNQGTRVFLQDVPRVIPLDRSITLHEGEICGEISALTRTPRTATVVAKSPMTVLEIRWQGFRDLMQRDTGLRQHVDRLYRENSLRVHLRETPLLANLNCEKIALVAAHTRFESFGEFQWNPRFRVAKNRDIAERIQAEPVIAAQGEYINGLILLRNGFARVCRQFGHGQQTVSYIGKGHVFGLREIVHNWRTGQQRPWLLSLRAVGYVDVLWIPIAIVEDHILPTLRDDLLPPPLPYEGDGDDSDSDRSERRQHDREETIDRGLIEFLVEKRFVNGTKAMVIDLNRCTRCDDCVRACAATHNNNPRFARHGPKFDHWMVANACMHCADPVCMIGCPTGAIARDVETGNVTINDRTCIGCSTCANSCPYHNIRMVEINDRTGARIVDASGEPILKATKCDYCAEQLGGPACQRACPHDALVRIDLTTPVELSAWTR
jgi:Fe-S-cluster-containing dehydrogenase component/CRP-like cAMP-binding protein